MTKQCLGCGANLQDDNILLEGYTTDLKNDYCKRCFKMKNYGEYEFTTKSNEEFLKILERIGKTKSLVLYVVDLLSVPNNLMKIKDILKKNKIILILNKKDALPLSTNDKKIIEYFQNQDLGFDDILIISALKNYNLDNLMKIIKKHRTYQNVYVVGDTNAGKSTLINKIINNYSVEKSDITISPMPSTTLNEIKMKIKDFYLIDTPGLVDKRNILNYVNPKQIKKISPHKEIKPKTYQIKQGQAIIIEDFLRIDYVEGIPNSFTLYISNDLKVKRINGKRHNTLKDLSKKDFDLKYRTDIVVNGLGFIKCVFDGKVEVYIDKDAEVFTRNSMI